jgi:hypothetical protein
MVSFPGAGSAGLGLFADCLKNLKLIKNNNNALPKANHLLAQTN